jgi:hypothetical protein
LEFSVMAVLVGLYGLFFVFLLLLACIRGARLRRRRAAFEILIPRIREKLVDFLAGNNDLATFREFARVSRPAVAEAILSLRNTVSGGARDRLCELALELGLVHEWCHDAQSADIGQRRTAYLRLAFICSFEPCRRVAGDLLLHALDDPDRDVWLLAARALTRSGDIGDVEQVFEIAIRHDLLVRILLVDDLRRHASALCGRVVPTALFSGDRPRVLATLRILKAWERAVQVDRLEELIGSRDPQIRLESLRVAPLTSPTPPVRHAIVEALTAEDGAVCTAAALAASQLRMAEAIPQLARLLRTASAETARAAAAGLAGMPPRGWDVLEELSENANPVIATPAREALERVRGQGRPVV